MGDQADAGGEEFAGSGRAWDLLAEILAEGAIGGGDVDAHLLEHPPLHHRHHAAAAFMAVISGALPFLALEPAGRKVAVCAGQRILDRLERGADAVAQGAEPGAGALALLLGREMRGGDLVAGGLGGGGGCIHGSCPVWRSASVTPIAAAWATLIERMPGRIGMRMRASAASCTSGGTPALSRPTTIRSSGRKAKSA